MNEDSYTLNGVEVLSGKFKDFPFWNVLPQIYPKLENLHSIQIKIGAGDPNYFASYLSSVASVSSQHQSIRCFSVELNKHVEEEPNLVFWVSIQQLIRNNSGSLQELEILTGTVVDDPNDYEIINSPQEMIEHAISKCKKLKELKIGGDQFYWDFDYSGAFVGLPLERLELSNISSMTADCRRA